MLEKDATISLVQYVNTNLIRRLSNKTSVVFGQNIIAGSRVSGLGANLEKQTSITAINTPNVENTLIGFGLGLMIQGIDSCFVMKQHDFALLGLDQLTNTVNVAKTYPLNASFILMMVVVDSGFEGPQASLNNLDEFASLSRSPVYFLNSKANIDQAFQYSHSPGVHLMALSQKNLKKILPDDQFILGPSRLAGFIQNSLSSDLLIIYFGLDLDYLYQIQHEFKSVGIESASLVVGSIGSNFSYQESELILYRSIVVVETSKSEVTYSQKLSLKLISLGHQVTFIGRVPSNTWSYVNEDFPEIKPSEVVNIWRGKQNDIK